MLEENQSSQDGQIEVKDDYEERVKELHRRANVLKYFEGAGDFRSGEGFGYVVGGALCIVMGFVIFPIMLGGLSGPSGVKYAFWVMGVIGIYLAIKGTLVMRGEDKTPRTPITDEEFEETYQYDLARAKEEAESALCLAYGIPHESEFIHMIGPNYYTANRHIPLLWKADGNGRIRYSNIALVTMVFEASDVYAHTCLVNHRDGIIAKSHCFAYNYEKLGTPRIEERQVDRLTSEHKIEKKDVLMLIIPIEGKEDVNELTVVLTDHAVEQKPGGHFDETETRAAAELITEKIEQGSEKKRIDKPDAV